MSTIKIVVVVVVLGSPEFNLSATLVNSQLVCLPPVGILNTSYVYLNIFHCFIGPEKPQWGVANYMYMHMQLPICCLL